MAVTTTVKVKGDGDEAVAAVRGVAASFRAAVSPLNGFAEKIVGISAGVIGAQSAVALMRSTVMELITAVKLYAEENELVKASFSRLSNQVDIARLRIGEFVIGGDNAQIMAGALGEVLAYLTQALGDTAGAQRVVINGLAALIDIGAHAIEVVALLRLGLGGLQIALAALKVAWETQIGVLVVFGTVLVDGIAGGVQIALEALQLLAVGFSQLAPLGGDALRSLSANFIGAIDGIGEDIDGLQNRVREFGTITVQGMSRDIAEGAATIGGIRNSMLDGFIATAELAAGLHGVADATRDGTVASVASTYALHQEAGAAREVADAMTILEQKRAASALIESTPAFFRDKLGQDVERAKAADVAARQAAIEAAERARADAAEEAARRIADAIRLEQDAMQRRLDTAQSTGAALSDALAVGVLNQKDASAQIIRIVTAELQKRVIAAVATSALLSSTPGGQFFAAALTGAIGFAGAALAQLGNGGGGGGNSGRGTTYAPTITVNYTSTGGARSRDDAEELANMVADATRRGLLRGQRA